MAQEIIQNGISTITLDNLKYKVNTYSEQVGWLQIVNIVNPAAPFIVAEIYSGIVYWKVPPTGTKFKKSDGLDVILD